MKYTFTVPLLLYRCVAGYSQVSSSRLICSSFLKIVKSEREKASSNLQYQSSHESWTSHLLQGLANKVKCRCASILLENSLVADRNIYVEKGSCWFNSYHFEENLSRVAQPQIWILRSEKPVVLKEVDEQYDMHSGLLSELLKTFLMPPTIQNKPVLTLARLLRRQAGHRGKMWQRNVKFWMFFNQCIRAKVLSQCISELRFSPHEILPHDLDTYGRELVAFGGVRFLQVGKSGRKSGSTSLSPPNPTL